MNIAFRVDASTKIGTGHMMRCLTLADAFKKRGAETRFICRHIPDNFVDRLAEKGHQLTRLSHGANDSPKGDLPHSEWLETTQHRDAEDSIGALSGAGWDWIIVDHYALDARWEAMLRPFVKRIMVIDDLADRMHDCDILLDQNAYLDMEKRYVGKVPEKCSLLQGSRYALLREEYMKARRGVLPRDGEVKRVLVFFGGVDADNLTLRTIRILPEIAKGIHVDVVVGAQHPDIPGVESFCAQHGFDCYVQTDRMAELMVKADLAIGAGGSATWERCSVGLPTFAICVAENQRRLLHDAAHLGLVYAPDINAANADEIKLHLRALFFNSALRSLISRNGLSAFDGLGTRRLFRKMGLSDVEIRLATKEDGENLLSWRNHPDVRSMSNITNEIDREAHFRWLDAVIANSQRHLLIGSSNGQPVGVVRFDLQGNSTRISIYLVPEKHIRGAGSELLVAAEQWLLAHHPEICIIEAEVLFDNVPSHRLFINSGYAVHNTLYVKEFKA